MPTTTDLLGLAIDKNPVDFADRFNQIMMQKAADAIDNKRVELAQSMYADDNNEEDFGDDELDAEMDDDFEDDDMDLDLDDLDLDLDDIDLEGIIDDSEDA